MEASTGIPGASGLGLPPTGVFVIEHRIILVILIVPQSEMPLMEHRVSCTISGLNNLGIGKILMGEWGCEAVKRHAFCINIAPKAASYGQSVSAFCW